MRNYAIIIVLVIKVYVFKVVNYEGVDCYGFEQYNIKILQQDLSLTGLALLL